MDFVFGFWGFFVCLLFSFFAVGGLELEVSVDLGEDAFLAKQTLSMDSLRGPPVCKAPLGNLFLLERGFKLCLLFPIPHKALTNWSLELSDFLNFRELLYFASVVPPLLYSLFLSA